jgi:hypothetical protein
VAFVAALFSFDARWFGAPRVEVVCAASVGCASNRARLAAVLLGELALVAALLVGWCALKPGHVERAASPYRTVHGPRDDGARSDAFARFAAWVASIGLLAMSLLAGAAPRAVLGKVLVPECTLAWHEIPTVAGQCSDTLDLPSVPTEHAARAVPCGRFRVLNEHHEWERGCHYFRGPLAVHGPVGSNGTWRVVGRAKHSGDSMTLYCDSGRLFVKPSWDPWRGPDARLPMRSWPVEPYPRASHVDTPRQCQERDLYDGP